MREDRLLLAKRTAIINAFEAFYDAAQIGTWVRHVIGLQPPLQKVTDLPLGLREGGLGVSYEESSVEHAMQVSGAMQIDVDTEHARVVREVLENRLKELRIESARADSHDYRLQLHGREHLIEDVLAQLGAPVR